MAAGFREACVRCSLLRPDPAQRARLSEIRDNLIARIAEAESEGWLGEVEGLETSLAATQEKLAPQQRSRSPVRCDRPWHAILRPDRHAHQLGYSRGDFVIVLDTNQLRHAAFPHGAVLGMLRKIAKLGGHTLALPEMVVIEHVAHQRHEIEKSLTAARKALTTLGKAFGQNLTERVEDLSAEDATGKLQAALEDSFTVLPTPPGAANEALAREANRRPPAEQVWEDSDGKPVKARGARDAVIWLTLLEAASQANEEIWFVSQDRDFGNDSKSDFHGALRDEAQSTLGNNAERLRLLSGGIDQLLGELATPTKAPENLASMLKSSVVAYAVHLAMGGPDLFLGLLPTLPVGVGGALTSQSIALDESRVIKSRTYQVDDRIWVSAQLACLAHKSYHYSTVEGAGVFSTSTTKVTFRFEATILLEIENGKARSAEAVSLGPITVNETAQTPGRVRMLMGVSRPG